VIAKLTKSWCDKILERPGLIDQVRIWENYCLEMHYMAQFVAA